MKWGNDSACEGEKTRERERNEGELGNIRAAMVARCDECMCIWMYFCVCADKFLYGSSFVLSTSSTTIVLGLCATMLRSCTREGISLAHTHTCNSYAKKRVKKWQQIRTDTRGRMCTFGANSERERNRMKKYDTGKETLTAKALPSLTRERFIFFSLRLSLPLSLSLESGLASRPSLYSRDNLLCYRVTTHTARLVCTDQKIHKQRIHRYIFAYVSFASLDAPLRDCTFFPCRDKILHVRDRVEVRKFGVKIRNIHVMVVRNIVFRSTRIDFFKINIV